MNRIINSLFILLALLLVKPSAAPLFERVDSDLKNYDTRVQLMRDDFNKLEPDISNKEWVISKLNFMFEIDQYMRSMMMFPSQSNYTSEETEYFKKQFAPRFENLDRQNTSELKDLLKIYYWFKISEFGEKADSQAWILVQHADLDPQFQKNVLIILADLWPKKETSPKNYAYLFDRVAASWNDPSKRTLQRYGNQGLCIGYKAWEPIPMENPEHINERRASVGLNTLEEYKLQVREFCP
jgi:hypothetical protein